MSPLERSTHDREALAEYLRVRIAAAADRTVTRGTGGTMATQAARAAQRVGQHLRRLILAAGFKP